MRVGRAQVELEACHGAAPRPLALAPLARLAAVRHRHRSRGLPHTALCTMPTPTAAVKPMCWATADLAEAVAEGDRLVREYELRGEAACSVKELQDCDSKIKKATADLVAETAELNARKSMVPGA